MSRNFGEDAKFVLLRLPPVLRLGLMERDQTRQENQAVELSASSAPNPKRTDPFKAIKNAYVGPSFGCEKGVRNAIVKPQEIASQYPKELSVLETEFVEAFRQLRKVAQAQNVQPKFALAALRTTIGSDSFVLSLYLLQATAPFREESVGVSGTLLSRFEEALGAISMRHGDALCRALHDCDEEELSRKVAPIVRELSNFQERGIDFEGYRLDSILDNCRVLSEVMTSRNSPFKGIIERWLEDRRELKDLFDRTALALR